MHKLKTLKLTVAALLMAGAALPASAGPTINLIDIGGVTGSPAEEGFRIAAKYWESVLTNNAVINFQVGYAPLPPSVPSPSAAPRSAFACFTMRRTSE